MKKEKKKILLLKYNRKKKFENLMNKLNLEKNKEIYNWILEFYKKKNQKWKMN